jgi:hypothetical protein
LLLGAGNTLPVPDIDKLDDQTEDAEVGPDWLPVTGPELGVVNAVPFAGIV